MVVGRGRRARLLLTFALLGLLLGVLPPLAVSAAPLGYVVTTTLDNVNDAKCAVGSCTLRQAVNASNANDPGAGNQNAISFAASVTGAITLTAASGGTLTLSKAVTITGPGATVLAIDGGCTGCDPGGTPSGGVQVFIVGTVTATISGLTIQHGNANAITGGGIANTSGGTLTVRDDLFTRNVAFIGGGIINANATLIVDRTTFEGNTGSQGGGINNNVGGILTVTNSTFANNQSQTGGAGVLNFNQASVTNTTIGGNGGPATVGGGIYNAIGSLTLTGSIVAGNGGSSGPDVHAATAVTDGGYNVIGSPANNAFVDGTNHDRVGTAATPLDPKLTALGSFGGPTQIFALLPTSPALDLIPAGTLGCGSTLATDQRSITRPQPSGGACDSGSFEARYSLVITGGSPQSAVVGQPFATPLAVTLTSGDGVTALGGAAVTFTPLPGGSGQSATVVGSPATTNASGQASVTATANGIAGAYSVTASATGAASASFSLTNAAPPIALTPTGLPAGAKGVAYPATTITASGGTSPYTFAVTTGALPGGLTLDPTTGVLSGTPTATGTFPFTVTATDANSFTGTQAYTIAVTAAPLVSIAVAPNPATLKVGQGQQFTATGTYADSSTADLTSQVTWSSDASTIVGVDTTGKGTGKIAGTAHLTATQGAVSGQATVTVGPPVLTGVQPAPAPANRPGGASVPGTPAPLPSPAPTGSPATGGSAPISAPTGR